MPLLSSLRPEEWLVPLAALFGSALLLARPGQPVARACAALALLLVVWQLALRGLHWQFAPVLFALVLIASALLLRQDQASLPGDGAVPPHGSIAQHLHARPAVLPLLCAALAVLSAALAWALPLFRLPIPSGPYLVGTRTLSFTDPATGRELVTQLWYPAAAPSVRLARYARLRESRPALAYMAWLRTDSFADAPVAPGPFPLLLFNHRWAGRRTQNTALCQELASRGYVVAAPDHPGSASRVQLASGQVVLAEQPRAFDPPYPNPAATEALWRSDQGRWVRDSRFLLGALAAETRRSGSWLAGAIDLRRIGAFGHSFGGSVSLALLDSAATPAVTAAVNLDGWSFGAWRTRTTQPVLLLYGAAERAGSPAEAALDAADSAAVSASLARFGGERLWLRGFTHADFTDAPLYSPLSRLFASGSHPAPRSVAIVGSLVASFFDRTLRGSTAPPPAWPEAAP